MQIDFTPIIPTASLIHILTRNAPFTIKSTRWFTNREYYITENSAMCEYLHVRFDFGKKKKKTDTTRNVTTRQGEREKSESNCQQNIRLSQNLAGQRDTRDR